jgi:hypothetical protein
VAVERAADGKLGTLVALVLPVHREQLAERKKVKINIKRKNMKISTMLAVAAVASGLLVQQARANGITGFVSMGGNIVLNANGLASATAATSFSSVNVSGGTGSYLAAAPYGQVATWTTPLSFVAGPQVINPLWTFTTAGGETFTFLLASTSSYVVNGGATSATLTGSGTLTGTGTINYSPTAGSFSLTINDVTGGSSGQASFGFGASNAALPDGGLTIAMLGGALVGLQMLRRKLS